MQWAITKKLAKIRTKICILENCEALQTLQSSPILLESQQITSLSQKISAVIKRPRCTCG